MSDQRRRDTAAQQIGGLPVIYPGDGWPTAEGIAIHINRAEEILRELAELKARNTGNTWGGETWTRQPRTPDDMQVRCSGCGSVWHTDQRSASVVRRCTCGAWLPTRLRVIARIQPVDTPERDQRIVAAAHEAYAALCDGPTDYEEAVLKNAGAHRAWKVLKDAIDVPNGPAPEGDTEDRPCITMTPGVRSGWPCINGSRLDTKTVADHAEQYGLAESAREYEISEEAVRLAIDYESGTFPLGSAGPITASGDTEEPEPAAVSVSEQTGLRSLWTEGRHLRGALDEGGGHLPLNDRDSIALTIYDLQQGSGLPLADWLSQCSPAEPGDTETVTLVKFAMGDDYWHEPQSGIESQRPGLLIADAVLRLRPASSTEGGEQ